MRFLSRWSWGVKVRVAGGGACGGKLISSKERVFEFCLNLSLGSKEDSATEGQSDG